MKKLKTITILVVLIFASLHSQIDTLKTALLLIDIQEFYFKNGFSELVDPEQASLNAQKILTKFRETNNLIVHVKHNVENEGKIHKHVAPKEGEKIIIKDEVSCFYKTDLNKFLDSNNIKQVVVCGMMTHMCVEGAVRAAHDLNYKVMVVGDACATKNIIFGENEVKAKDVHDASLASFKYYGKVMNTEEFISTFF